MISLSVLPAMQCDTGCGECCGIVMVQEGELARVNAYARQRGIEPRRHGITCPWYQDGACAVYEARPYVCRLFGHVEQMTCPRGYNTNIKDSLHQRLLKDFKKKGKPRRFLHEVFDDAFQLMRQALEAISPAPPRDNLSE